MLKSFWVEALEFCKTNTILHSPGIPNPFSYCKYCTGRMFWFHGHLSIPKASKDTEANKSLNKTNLDRKQGKMLSN